MTKRIGYWDGRWRELIRHTFFETIRDLAAGQPGYPATVDEARLRLRVPLHESGHLMGAGHGTGPLDGIMNVNSVWMSDADAKFTVKHFGIFQAKDKPGFP